MKHSSYQSGDSSSSKAKADQPKPGQASANTKGAAGSLAAADSEAITKEEAASARDTIARRVGELVHAEGFDSETGHQLLCDKQPLVLAGHETRGVRLIKGSPSANWSSDQFNVAVETICLRIRGLDRSSEAWRRHTLTFDALLRPREGMDVDQSFKHLSVAQGDSPRPETGG